MPKYLVRCTITRSVTVDADNEDEAVKTAPEAEDEDEWDETASEYEAEETDGDDEDEYHAVSNRYREPAMAESRCGASVENDFRAGWGNDADASSSSLRGAPVIGPGSGPGSSACC